MRACDRLEAFADQVDTLPELAWRAALAEHDGDEPAGYLADDDLILLARLRAGPDEPRGSPP